MISGLLRTLSSKRAARARGSTVRKAAMRDIPPMLELINGYAARGIMLPRTEFEMSENIRDFSVVMQRRCACSAAARCISIFADGG